MAFSSAALPAEPFQISRQGEFKPGRLLEALFSVGALFWATGAVFQLLRSPNGQDAVTVNNGGIDTLVNALTVGITAVLIVPHRRALLQVIRSAPLVWSMPALAVVSVLWSTDPSRSLHASAALIGAMMFGTYFAIRFNGSEQLLILTFTMAVITALSVGLILLVPSLGVDVGVHLGQWRGVFITKNAFGRAMAFAFATFLICGITHRPLRPIAFMLAAVAVWLIVRSESRTSLGIAAVMGLWAVARPIFTKVRIPAWLIAAAILAVFAVLANLVISQATVPHTVGSSDDTLTGRTMLWAAVSLKIATRPVLGYGYQAFWAGSRGYYVDVWRLVGWNPPHSHNGFLDVTLDLGFVGLAVFFVMYTRAFARAIALNRRSLPSVDRMWPACLILFVLLGNVTESSFLRNNVYWMLFTAAAVLTIRLEKSAPLAEDRPRRAEVARA